MYLTGVKDQKRDFNIVTEEDVPASWTIQVSGRPKPPKEGEDEKDEQEDAVCMACFDGMYDE